MTEQYAPSDEKKGTHRTKITAGGNVLQYDGNTSDPTADLSTLKVLSNSVVSTPKEKLVTLDIKNYYIATILVEDNTCSSKQTQFQKKYFKLTNSIQKHTIIKCI